MVPCDLSAAWVKWLLGGSLGLLGGFWSPPGTALLDLSCPATLGSSFQCNGTIHTSLHFAAVASSKPSSPLAWVIVMLPPCLYSFPHIFIFNKAAAWFCYESEDVTSSLKTLWLHFTWSKTIVLSWLQNFEDLASCLLSLFSDLNIF